MLPNPKLQYNLLKTNQQEILHAAEMVRLAKTARVNQPLREKRVPRGVASPLLAVVLWLKTLG